jgi:hypothetical protein
MTVKQQMMHLTSLAKAPQQLLEEQEHMYLLTHAAAMGAMHTVVATALEKEGFFFCGLPQAAAAAAAAFLGPWRRLMHSYRCCRAGHLGPTGCTLSAL